MRIIGLTLVLLGVALCAAALCEEPPVATPDVVTPAPATAVFRPVDVWVRTAGERLAAYQVEVTYDPKRVKIVGVEGGEKGPFNEAPYFDPKGKTGGRIVVAAFTADDEAAPAGRLRVARLHLRVEGGGDPDIQIRLAA